MEISILDNIIKVNLMERVNMYGKMVLIMMVNSKMDYDKDLVNYVYPIKHIMRDNLRMILKMEKESNFLKMEIIMKGNM
jgi:hypothetical protein